MGRSPSIEEIIRANIRAIPTEQVEELRDRWYMRAATAVVTELPLPPVSQRGDLITEDQLDVIQRGVEALNEELRIREVFGLGADNEGRQ